MDEQVAGAARHDLLRADVASARFNALPAVVPEEAPFSGALSGRSLLLLGEPSFIPNLTSPCQCTSRPRGVFE